jgi:hypothetical protein
MTRAQLASWIKRNAYNIRNSCAEDPDGRREGRKQDHARARAKDASYPFAGIIRIRFEGFTGRAGVSGGSHPQDGAEYSGSSSASGRRLSR